MKTTRATIEPADLANVKNLERLAAEVREFRDLKARYLAAEARIARLEEALRELLWYCGQLEVVVYDQSEWGRVHETVARVRDALEGKA